MSTTRELSPGKSLARGKPAPAGFSVTVSSYIRQDAVRRDLNSPQAPYPVKERFRMIDSVAHEPAAAGDSDPRVRSLWEATRLEHGSGATSWSPGPNQIAVLDAAASSSAQALEGGFQLDDGKLLDALAHASMLDVMATLQRRLDRSGRAADAPPSHQRILAEMTTRAENAERSLAEARQSVENMRQAHIAEKERRRFFQTIVTNGPAAHGLVPGREPESAVVKPKAKRAAKAQAKVEAPALTASGPVGGLEATDTGDEEK